MKDTWQGRRAVVVGAQGSVGQAICDALAQRGARIVAMVRRPYAETPAAPAEVVLSPLGDPDAVLAACREAARGPVDALFVASGAYAGGATAATPSETYLRLMWTNAGLPFFLLQGLLDPLQAAGGKAVLLGALAAEEPRAGQAAYAASKSALHSIVRSAARELQGTGARVNALLPAVIDSAENRRAMPQRDPTQWVSPKRLAELALALAGPLADDLQGALIPVRGAL